MRNILASKFATSIPLFDSIESKLYDSETHTWSLLGALGDGTESKTIINNIGNASTVFLDDSSLNLTSFDTDKWSNYPISLTNNPNDYSLAMNDHNELIVIFAADGNLYSTSYQRDIPLENTISVRYYKEK